MLEFVILERDCGNVEPVPPHIPRNSKAARPWNHPLVQLAGQTYGVRGFKSVKDVQTYEGELVRKNILSPEDRISCEAPGCQVAKREGKHNHGEQGLLF